MPHYFFHVRNEVDARDDEGIELSDLESAIAEATAGALSILSQEVKEGRLDLRQHIDITDETGALLHCLAFEDALKIIR